MPFLLTRTEVADLDAEAKVLGSCPYRNKAKSSGWHPELRAEQRRLETLAPGESVLTSNHTQNSKYEIVTLPPIWEGGDRKETQKLSACYTSAMDLAFRRRCKSVAFPLLSADCHGFPKALAYRTAVETIRDFLSRREMTVYLSIRDTWALPLPRLEIPGLRPPQEEKPPEHWWLTEPASTKEQKPVPCCLSAPVCVLPEKDKEAICPASLEDRIGKAGETFSQNLLHLIDEKGLKDPEVYQRANVDRRLFSKIRNHAEYQPSKPTALAFALALELNLDETLDLIGRAGFTLTTSSKFDIILSYFIESGNYDIYEINQALFAYEQPLIGA